LLSQDKKYVREKFAQVWETTLRSILEMKTISLPRCTGYKLGDDLELHCLVMLLNRLCLYRIY
jgi:hypothetical protein